MADEPAPVAAPEWAAIALLAATQVLAGLLEVAFLTRFYAGTVIVPVAILAAVGLNIALSRWGIRIVRRALGGVLAMIGWLLPVLVLTMYNRPEGDLFVTGEHGQQYAFYGLLLAGAIAGCATIVLSTDAPAAARPRPGRPLPGKRPLSR